MPYSASTWQQSPTSAAAGQLPTGLSALMKHLVRSQDDIGLLECAMKRELSRTAGPRGIGLWIHEGWIAAGSCVKPQWMIPQLWPKAVHHLGQAKSHWPCSSRFGTSSLIWMSDPPLLHVAGRRFTTLFARPAHTALWDHLILHLFHQCLLLLDNLLNWIAFICSSIPFSCLF